MNDLKNFSVCKTSPLLLLVVDVNEKKEKTNYPPCNDQDWQRHLPHHGNEAHPFFYERADKEAVH